MLKEEFGTRCLFEEEGETLLRDELVRYAQKFHIQFFISTCGGPILLNNLDDCKTIAMLGTRVEMELQRLVTLRRTSGSTPVKEQLLQPQRNELVS